MRAIATLANEQDARRLSNYLLTLEIASQVDPMSDGFCIWIRDEDKVERAKQELAAFLQNPADPKYQLAEQTAALLRQHAAVANRQYQKNLRDIRARWRRPTPQNCPLTLALIAISIFVGAMSRLGNEKEPLLNHLFMTRLISTEHGEMADTSLPEIRKGQVWRLITPIFIHLGPMHILFNLWCLYNLGGVIEMQRGTWRLALMVLVTALVSNLVQCFWTHPIFGGMSGVIYGLFGYAWMKSRYDSSAGVYVSPDTVVLMIGWLFLCMTGFIGHIANAAHVAGLVCGIVIGFASAKWKRLGRR